MPVRSNSLRKDAYRMGRHVFYRSVEYFTMKGKDKSIIGQDKLITMEFRDSTLIPMLVTMSSRHQLLEN